jgi:hypothetical protein
LGSLIDEQLIKDVAPSKNSGLYILGHLIAVHDDMLKLLDMGDKMFPEYFKIFIESPDKTFSEMPSTAELRANWKTQCDAMKVKFDNASPATWFEKHTAVSAEDFANEPHRNKLNIIITRTSHLQYHMGQLALLK